MVRIFLSYAREDEAQVRDVYQRLKAEGFEPWMDVINIAAGQNWQDEIEQAVETSDFVLMFLSTARLLKRAISSVNSVVSESARKKCQMAVFTQFRLSSMTV